MDLAQLGRVDRAIAVAGGPRKLAAIQAALAGGLISGLITDRFTAEHLLADADVGESPASLSAAARA
jgi:DNA-binding transcriptional regulator LsrR (DeoR family)